MKQDEIVIRAKVLDFYQGARQVQTIMGPPNNVIYAVEVTAVIGSNSATIDKNELREGAVVWLFQSWSNCERYVPRDFGEGKEKRLVVKQGKGIIYGLVGGE